MKKLLIALLVVTIIGAGVVFAAMRSTPERVACSKLGELCGSDNASLKDFDRCVEDFEQVHEGVGDDRFQETVECIDQSQTCARAVGCMAGTGTHVLKDAMKEFFKGFGETVF